MVENRLLILTLSQYGSTNLIGPLAFDGRGQDMDRVRHPEDRASRVAEPPSFFPPIRHARIFGAPLQANGFNEWINRRAVWSVQRLSIVLSSGEFPGILNKLAIPLILSGPVLISHWARILNAFVSSFWSVLKLLPRIVPTPPPQHNDGVNPSCHFVAQLSGSYQPHIFPV